MVKLKTKLANIVANNITTLQTLTGLAKHIKDYLAQIKAFDDVVEKVGGMPRAAFYKGMNLKKKTKWNLTMRMK